MSSYSHQNYFLKDKWLDIKKTKNHPKTCQKAHSFCNFQYQWAQQKQSTKIAGTVINQSIPNITLPKRQQRSITVSYDAITEQDLDDWIAQSLNRNITSILNPQKKFYIPSQLEDDLKHRYRKKSSILKGQQDIYFSGNTKKKGNIAIKGKPNLSELLFDYKKLQVKHNPGIPIRYRQNKNKKIVIKRRHALFLDHDIHYNRLVKDLSKSKQKHVKKQNPLFLTQTDTMFYSYNIQSLNRKSFVEQTPSSITETQYNSLKQPPKDVLSIKQNKQIKQQEMHENIRQKIMENTKLSEKKIMQNGYPPYRNQTKSVSSKQTKQVKSSTQIQKANYKFRPIKRQNSNMTTSMIDTKSIGKDKVLQKKILLLLNDMQILAEQIDFQMSELNIHVNEVSLKTIDTRPQSKWVVKAQQKLAQKQVQLSIDCYKQALIIQPEFFVPIFNIATLLQKQKMYFQAIRWFDICKQFEIDEQNVNFGRAIVYLKQMKFQQCFVLVEDLIKKYQITKKSAKFVYYYVRALCSKKLKKYEQAKSDYNILLKNCHPSNYSLISSFLFSVVFAKNRRLALKFDGLSYINFKQTLQIVYFTPQKKLRQQNQPLKSIAKKLVNAPFFKRFSISLVEKLLDHSTYQTVKNDSLIFINDDQTAILLSGIVVVRNHLKQFDKPQTVFVLEQGGVIGGGKLDNFMNEKSNNWFITKSDIQLIKIQKKSFNQFWKGQITFQIDFKYNFLKNVSLFKGLSDSTLLRICQKIEKVEFNQGTILFNDCSYRNQVINKHGIGFGLGKKTPSSDPRFVNMKKIGSERKKGKYRIAQLLKKHFHEFNERKFNKLKYPGLFILVKGKIQVEDDRGFRCQDLIGEREYFGENLLFDSDGFNNYGRMVVNSQSAVLYHLRINKLIWTFTSQDKQRMKQNSKDRQSVETLRFLRCRFLQCQNTRINYKFLLDGRN